MLLFDCRSVFEDCAFSGVPIQVSELIGSSGLTTRTQYINCTAGGFYFGRNIFKTGQKAFEGLLNYNNYTVTDFEQESQNGLVEKYALNGKEVFVNFIDNLSAKVINISGSDRTASFATNNRNAYKLGQLVVFSSSLSLTTCTPIGYGVITDTTGIISVKYISKPITGGIVNGQSYYVSCLYPAAHLGSFIGNIANGTTIAKIATDFGVSATGYVGNLVKSPYNNSNGGWFKVTAYNSGTNTFTTLGNNGSTFSIIDTALYFNNGATKTVETSSTANQTLATANPPILLYKGEQITELIKSDKAKTYECVRTGYTSLTGGETRQALWISPSANWSTFGNAGTADRVSFIGTTDAVPLTIRVGNAKAGRIEYSDQGEVAFGYGALSSVQPGIINANSGNSAFGSGTLNYNETGGLNTAIGSQALLENTSGNRNVAIGAGAMMGNITGNNNIAIGTGANVSSDDFTNSTVIGYNVSVSQSNTMVFGNSAVIGWGFGTNPASGKAVVVGTTSSNGNGAYLTTGGTWTNGSDINLKDDIKRLDGKEILAKLMCLPITKWRYRGTQEYHIGPMGQDFYNSFRLGIDTRSISSIDPAGIALLCIQEQQRQIETLKKLISALQQQINRLNNNSE